MDVTELSFASLCFYERVLISYSSGQDAVAGCCGRGDEPLVSIKTTL
jgi:hypothetical protein